MKGGDKMTLREKVNSFLEITGMSKTRFARLSGIHPTTMNLWLNSDGYDITSDNIKRIEICLDMQKSKIGKYLEQSK